MVRQNARRADIVQIIFREALLLVGVGVGIGVAGSLALSHSIRNLLFEVWPGDPITSSAVSILRAGIALFACFTAARRATQIDPMTALRCD
jgi:ABC-type antimicrobial peptide transport system permease subunit